MIVDRVQHPGWLVNSWLVAGREGGRGLLVDTGADVAKIYYSNMGTIGDNPNVIYPGQKLYIPGVDVVSTTAASSSASSVDQML